MSICPALLLCLLALAACQTEPPPRIYSEVVPSTELIAARPVDIAVLPIEDATQGQAARTILPIIREELARGLIQKYYSAMSLAKVDEVLEAQSVAAGSVADASWLRLVEGRFGESGTLAVRLTQWDTTRIMPTGRVAFAADVWLVSPGRAEPLWSGKFHGEVKAGGRGPTPLGRAAREASAAAEVVREIVKALPARPR